MTGSRSASRTSKRLPVLKPLWRRFRRATSLYNLAGVLNPVFDISVGGLRRPVFYDIDATAPALRRLDAAWPMIVATYDHVLHRVRRLPAYHMIDSDVIYSSGRQQRDVRWGVFMLTCFGTETEAAQKLCPELLALLRTIPRLYQAFFSVLEPGKGIPAHVGPSRVYLRYHLGLRVPGKATPVMRIKDRTYSWRDGESILFDDSWEHEIVNHAEEARAILIVDLERPLPRPLRAIAWFQRVTAARHYARRVVAKANLQFPADLLAEGRAVEAPAGVGGGR